MIREYSVLLIICLLILPKFLSLPCHVFIPLVSAEENLDYTPRNSFSMWYFVLERSLVFFRFEIFNFQTTPLTLWLYCGSCAFSLNLHCFLPLLAAVPWLARSLYYQGSLGMNKALKAVRRINAARLLPLAQLLICRFCGGYWFYWFIFWSSKNWFIIGICSRCPGSFGFTALFLWENLRRFKKTVSFLCFPVILHRTHLMDLFFKVEKVNILGFWILIFEDIFVYQFIDWFIQKWYSFIECLWYSGIWLDVT